MIIIIPIHLFYPWVGKPNKSSRCGS